jgi:hypothetical protein
MAGFFALGGVGISSWTTARRDAAQERREAKKRRADKFEELVAAVYEFDHWTDQTRRRVLLDDKDISQTVSPFAKLHSIAGVYFPQFGRLIGELDAYSSQYVSSIYMAAGTKVSKGPAGTMQGFNETYIPYMQKRDALLVALGEFAREEFQQGGAEDQ